MQLKFLLTNPVIVTIYSSSSENPISRLRLIKIFSFFIYFFFSTFPHLWFLSIDSSKLISSTFTLQQAYPLLPNFHRRSLFFLEITIVFLLNLTTAMTMKMMSIHRQQLDSFILISLTRLHAERVFLYFFRNCNQNTSENDDAVFVDLFCSTSNGRICLYLSFIFKDLKLSSVYLVKEKKIKIYSKTLNFFFQESR